MAITEVTPTNRRVSTHGSMFMEIGDITTAVSGDDSLVKTKLGRLVFIAVQGIGASDHDGIFYINSKTLSDTEDDPGWFIMDQQYTDEQTYHYLAIGYR